MFNNLSKPFLNPIKGKRFFSAVLFAFARPPLNLHVPEVPVTFAVYLLELLEHANLMAAVQMRKVRPKKKTFPRVRILERFGQVTKYSISFRKCEKAKFKNF